jgi:hypothetical protein
MIFPRRQEWYSIPRSGGGTVTLLRQEVVAITAAVNQKNSARMVSHHCASQFIFDDERRIANVVALTLPRCGSIFSATAARVEILRQDVNRPAG